VYFDDSDIAPSVWATERGLEPGMWLGLVICPAFFFFLLAYNQELGGERGGGGVKLYLDRGKWF